MESPKEEHVSAPGLTLKAEATRQRILEAALKLFATEGYEGTTMRKIATAAGCSLGLAYRYYASKEELVLGFYRRLARDLEIYVEALPRASIADRFQQTILIQFEQMAPYRDTFSALFTAALNPKSEVGVFSDNAADIRIVSRDIYVRVVTGASDAPGRAQVGDLATALYSMHLALMLFWLQDRTEQSKTTYEMLQYLHDMIDLVRPLLRLPPASKALARLDQILGPILGSKTQA